MLAGRFAPMVFPRIGSSRLAMGLVHGTAGAISGLGAASLVAGWPQHYDQVLAPLLNGAFAGGVHARGEAHPAAVDGGGAFTPPDAISTGHDGNAPAARPPFEISSAESKRAWDAAKEAWGTGLDAAKSGGERGAVPAEVTANSKTGAAEARSPEVRGASASADRAAGRPPGPQITAGPAASDAAAARSGAHSETAAPVQRAPADKPVAAGRQPRPDRSRRLGLSLAATEALGERHAAPSRGGPRKDRHPNQK